MNTPEHKNPVTPNEAEFEADKRGAWEGLTRNIRGLFNLQEDTDRAASI